MLTVIELAHIVLLDDCSGDILLNVIIVIDLLELEVMRVLLNQVDCLLYVLFVLDR